MIIVKSHTRKGRVVRSHKRNCNTKKSHIRIHPGIDHDEDLDEVTVNYKKGVRYRYHDVTPKQVELLKKDRSKGLAAIRKKNVYSPDTAGAKKIFDKAEKNRKSSKTKESPGTLAEAREGINLLKSHFKKATSGGTSKYNPNKGYRIRPSATLSQVNEIRKHHGKSTFKLSDFKPKKGLRKSTNVKWNSLM